jgi:hypothetical protein
VGAEGCGIREFAAHHFNHPISHHLHSLQTTTISDIEKD